MTTPWELEEIYASIGKAVWHLQFLEDVLVTYVTMRLSIKRPIALEAAMETLARERKKTLGTLLREAREGGLVQGDVANAFRLLVDERNWLIHRSMHECNDGLHRLVERESFLKRLDDLTDEAIRLKKQLYSDATRWLAEQGIDVAKAEALGEAQFRRLRG
jgi:hypothetical protein